MLFNRWQTFSIVSYQLVSKSFLIINPQNELIRNLGGTQNAVSRGETYTSCSPIAPTELEGALLWAPSFLSLQSLPLCQWQRHRMAPVAHAHGMVMSEYGIGSRDAAPQAQFMLQEPVRDASGKQGLRGTPLSL